MAIALTVVGLLLVLATLQDVFLPLFHPAGSGAMSDWIARAAWKIFRRLARTDQPLITFAGPAALLAGRACAAGRPPAVRLAGTTLGGAVEDFLAFVASTVLPYRLTTYLP